MAPGLVGTWRFVVTVCADVRTLRASRLSGNGYLQFTDTLKMPLGMKDERRVGWQGKGSVFGEDSGLSGAMT
eukprot:6204213-Pleurochrysis_carterae.AAC.2